MKYVLFIPVVCFFLQISGSHALASDGNDLYGNFLKDIPIQVGPNTIRVEAADPLGNRAHISIDIEGEKYALPPLTRVEAASQRKALYGKSFAIVIGINHYEKWPGLEFAAADANAGEADIIQSKTRLKITFLPPFSARHLHADHFSFLISNFFA